jgi:hypothetical protein
MEANTWFFGPALAIVGITFLAAGILVRMGKYRGWYLHKGDPLYSPKEFVYVCIPFGLTVLSMGIASLPPSDEIRQTLFWGITFPLGISVAVLLFWPPDWIKPAWVRWLEKNHKDILLLLLENARQTPDWEQRVATQAGLETWVAEVRRKHGL